MARKRVALVDDDRSIVSLLDSLLTEEGYDTCCCYSSAEGHECIKRESPDLVIVDLQMEHKEAGLDLLRLIRSDPSTTHLPVILYSADTQFLRLKAKMIADDNCVILEKPFELHHLLAQIEERTGGARELEA